jgi:hypothetical protein
MATKGRKKVTADVSDQSIDWMKDFADNGHMIPENGVKPGWTPRTKAFRDAQSGVGLREDWKKSPGRLEPMAAQADDWADAEGAPVEDWEDAGDWEDAEEASTIGADDVIEKADLGAWDRARLSFAGNEAERDAYLKKLHPSIELRKTGVGDRVFRIPEEDERYGGKWRFEDDPSPQGKDVLDITGDLPAGVAGAAGAMGGGAVAGPAGFVGGGAAGGYLGGKLKRHIARGLGIPELQTEEEQNVESTVNTIMGGVGGAMEGRAGKIAKQQDDVAKLGRPSAQQIAEEYQARVSRGLAPEAPTLQRLREIETIVPDMKYKPLPLHYESLKSKSNFRINDLRRNLPGEEADKIAHWEQQMKQEATEKIKGTAETAAKRPLKNAIESGQDIAKSAIDRYQQNKKELAPVFEMLQGVKINDPNGHAVMDLLLSSDAKIADNISYTPLYPEIPDGPYKFQMKPFNSTMGMSRESYGSLKQVVSDLNTPNLTFQEMQRMRDYLRKQINPTDPKKTAELENFRKSLLRFMEEKAVKLSPNQQRQIVKETFKRYAINEKNLSDFDHIIGGRLDDFNYKKLPKDELIVKRLFSSTKSVKRAQEILGPDAVRAAAADWVGQAVDDSINSSTRTISAPKLNKFLRANEPKLKMALGEKEYERMLALNDLQRIVPDMPSANPSGTAYQSNILGDLGRGRLLKVGKEIISGFQEGAKQRQAEKQLGDIMAGRESPDGALKQGAKKIGGAIGSGYGKLKKASKSKPGRAVKSGAAQAIIGDYIKDRLRGEPVENAD